jgi:protein-S-isoprenylcysteine O-methyltransferase Ste14
MNRPSPSPSAGVRIDPQLIYAIPLVIGLLVERGFPTRATPDRLAAPLGIGCLALGLALAGAAVRRFRAASTTLQPWVATTALVTGGPFRFSRNPIYLGYTLLYLGVAFWVNSLWPLLLLPALLWLMHRLVINREEAYLERQFGEGYLVYRSKVRRWL